MRPFTPLQSGHIKFWYRRQVILAPWTGNAHSRGRTPHHSTSKPPGHSGLEILQMAIDGRLPPPPMAFLMDIRLIEVVEGPGGVPRQPAGVSLQHARQRARRLRRHAARFGHGLRRAQHARRRRSLYDARIQDQLPARDDASKPARSAAPASSSTPAARPRSRKEESRTPRASSTPSRRRRAKSRRAGPRGQAPALFAYCVCSSDSSTSSRIAAASADRLRRRR